MDFDKRTLARAHPAGLAWWDGGARYSDDPQQWAWTPAQHLSLLSQKLVDVATGRCPRLIVTMPPRHGKSELISKYTPAWFLGRFPEKKVMLASYADTFAAQWGRKARDVLKDNADLFDVKINPETSGGQYWELIGHRGVMVTAGVGGGLTGKGADLLVIDDPIKNSDEAQSQTIRDKHWDWWLSSVRTRLQKDAGVVCVMTRWHEDDLVGRFLANDPSRNKDGTLIQPTIPGDPTSIIRRTDVDGDEWVLLNLPAFAEPGTGDLDPTPDPTNPTHQTDAVGRVAGQILWPSMFNAEWMAQTRRAMGEYWFSAMYMQRPSPADGLLFRKKNFRYYESHHTGETHLITLHTDAGPSVVDIAYCTKFQTVDVAASEDEQADYTVVSTWVVTPDGILIWWDCEWVQFDTTAVKGFVRRKYYEHRPNQCLIERLGHGLNVIQELLREGLPIGRLEPDKDKVSRALPVCARYEALQVYHPMHATWIQEAEKQLLGFPNTKNDDIVDTVSYAGIELPFMIGSGQGFRTSTTAGRRDREIVTERATPTSRVGRRGTITSGLLNGDL